MSFFQNGVLVELWATTATAAGTTTLTKSSKSYQQFTGTTTQTIVLPDATTLKTTGVKYVFQNRSTGLLTVNTNGGAFLCYVLPGADRTVQCSSVATAAGTWDISLGAIGTLNSPLAMYANGTAVLSFSPSQVRRPDGSFASVPSLNSTTPSFVASTVNLQTQATTGGTFSIVWPTSTVGQFRRLAFSLSSAGTMIGTFSAEAAAVASLADPGTLYSASGLAVGYIDLQATATTPAFKTAGSATSIVEASVGGVGRIFNLGSGSGGGGGSPVVAGSTASPNAIVAATGVTFTSGAPRNWQFITGSGGPVTVTANPQVALGTLVGQELYLIGQNNTNTVSLADGNGLSLAGPIELGLNSMLGLLWDGTTWLEFFRRS